MCVCVCVCIWVERVYKKLSCLLANAINIVIIIKNIKKKQLCIHLVIGAFMQIVLACIRKVVLVGNYKLKKKEPFNEGRGAFRINKCDQKCSYVVFIVELWLGLVGLADLVLRCGMNESRRGYIRQRLCLIGFGACGALKNKTMCYIFILTIHRQRKKNLAKQIQIARYINIE